MVISERHDKVTNIQTDRLLEGRGTYRTLRILSVITLQYIGYHRYEKSAISVILEKIFPDPLKWEYQTDEDADMNRVLDIDREPSKTITACACS